MISIHDSPELVEVSKAYCPEKQIEGNPVLEVCGHFKLPGP